jgi:hypothetical protein
MSPAISAETTSGLLLRRSETHNEGGKLARLIGGHIPVGHRRMRDGETIVECILKLPVCIEFVNHPEWRRGREGAIARFASRVATRAVDLGKRATGGDIIRHRGDCCEGKESNEQDDCNNECPGSVTTTRISGVNLAFPIHLRAIVSSGAASTYAYLCLPYATDDPRAFVRTEAFETWQAAVDRPAVRGLGT